MTKPVNVTVGTDDAMLGTSQAEQLKEILEKKGGRVTILDDQAAHGFSVRGDLNNDHERKLKEKAFELAIEVCASLRSLPLNGAWELTRVPCPVAQQASLRDLRTDQGVYRRQVESMQCQSPMKSPASVARVSESEREQPWI